MQSEVKIKAENNPEWVEYHIRPSVATYGCLQDSGICYVYTPNFIRGYLQSDNSDNLYTIFMLFWIQFV